MKKRAFIKYTEYGKIIPGSMIVTQGSFPSKEGRAKWYEVPMNKCCSSYNEVFDLERFLSRMNNCYTQVTSLVPQLVYFSDYTNNSLLPNYIRNGCADMYDDGNMYNTNLTQLYNDISGGNMDYSLNIPYTHTQYAEFDECNYTNPPMNGYIANSPNYFGVGSKYFTNMYPGMFITAATGVNISEFSITGDLGSDGDGVNAVYIATAHPGWTAFIKTNTDTSEDPSVNHIILVYGDIGGTTQLYNNTGEYDDHCIQGLGSTNTAIISIVVATDFGTPALTQEQALAIANKTLDVYNDATCVPLQALRLQFTDIAEVDFMIGDSTNVNDWNTFFDLPTYGNEFTSVTVDGNWVYLYGGSNIELKDYIFSSGDSTILLKVMDDANCIIGMQSSCFTYQENFNQVSLPACTYIIDNGVDYGSFAYCYKLTNISLPALQTIGIYTFEQNGNSGYTYLSLPELTTAGEAAFYQDDFPSKVITLHLPKLQTAGDRCFFQVNATELNLPSLTSCGNSAFSSTHNTSSYHLPLCTDIGGSCDFDNVFSNVFGNTVTLTVPSSVMTCYSGGPDVDIFYLQSNNTVNIITT